ncbi:MAG: hypothetical protein V9G12_16165 [Microthrixaceae bacterium]
MQRRSKRGFKFAAFGLALALTAGACGGDDKKSDEEGPDTTVPTTDAPAGKPTPGGELTYSVEADASGGYCLPTAQLAAGGIQVANAVYDSLFVFDKDFKATPTWPSRRAGTPSTRRSPSSCARASRSTTAPR